MSKEREILQRFHSGMSQRSIALGLHVSRNTVAKVIAAYKASNISQEMLDAIDDDELHRKLCPDEVPNSSVQPPIPEPRAKEHLGRSDAFGHGIQHDLPAPQDTGRQGRTLFVPRDYGCLTKTKKGACV